MFKVLYCEYVANELPFVDDIPTENIFKTSVEKILNLLRTAVLVFVNPSITHARGTPFLSKS